MTVVKRGRIVGIAVFAIWLAPFAGQPVQAEDVSAALTSPTVIIPSSISTIASRTAASADGRVLALAEIESDGLPSTLSATVSVDGGVTWTAPFALAPDVSVFAYDVSVSADGSHIVVAWTVGMARSRAYVASTTDGGVSWSTPVLIHGDSGIEDLEPRNLEQSSDGKTQLVVLESDSTSRTTSDGTLIAAVSRDAGSTWHLQFSPARDLYQTYHSASVSADGGLVAYAYESYGADTSRGQLRFAISSDGGNTWSSERAIVSGPSGSPGSQFVQLSASRIAIVNDEGPAMLVSTDGGATFATSVIGGGFTSHVECSSDQATCVEVMANGGRKGRTIYTTRSTDHAATWAPRQLLSDDGENFPLLATTPDFAEQAIVWTSWHHDQLNVAFSADQGKSWSKPANILSPGNFVRIATWQKDIAFLNWDTAHQRWFVGWNNTRETSNTFLGIHLDVTHLRFHGEGNTAGEVPASRAVLSGTTLTIAEMPNPISKPHNTFVGWTTSANGLGTSYAPSGESVTVVADIDLYAQWKPVPSHRVKLLANAVLRTSPASVVVYDDDAAFTVPDVTAASVNRGMKFVGWSTRADGAGPIFRAGSTIDIASAPTALYAVAAKRVTCAKGKLAKTISGPRATCPVGWSVRA